MIDHLVLFKLKDTATAEQKDLMVQTMQELASIDGVVQLASGLNHSQEGKSKGFELGLRITFRDQAALDAYLPSEQHRTTIGKIRQHFADVIVLDFTW
jgi:hypothetical protein